MGEGEDDLLRGKKEEHVQEKIDKEENQRINVRSDVQDGNRKRMCQRR